MMFVVRKCLPILLGCGWLLGAGSGLLAADGAWRYVPDVEFEALSRRGNPKDINRGGGKRGCMKLAKVRQDDYLRSLVPVSGGGVSGVTRPIFWVYSPYVSRVPLGGLLVVRRAHDYLAEPLQMAQVQLSGRPGLVGVSLPLPIEERGLLEWSLTVVCDAENESRNPFVTGWVLVRPDAAVSRRVVGLTRAEQVGVFARSGYWYDALAAADGDVGRQKLLEAAGIK
jgi:Domain of Unknown Function (DUF928)